MSYIGAGVLPYYYDTKLRDVIYLLGEQKTTEHGQVYSDFGGRPKCNEEAIDCAARECAEELGVLGNQAEVKNLLQDSVRTTRYDVRKKEQTYYLYVLKLDQKSEELWTHRATSCSCLPCAFKPNDEKSKVKWFVANQVYEAVSKHFGTVKAEDKEYRLRPAFITEIKQLPGYLAKFSPNSSKVLA